MIYVSLMIQIGYWYMLFQIASRGGHRLLVSNTNSVPKAVPAHSVSHNLISLGLVNPHIHGKIRRIMFFFRMNLRDTDLLVTRLKKKKRKGTAIATA